LSAGVSAGGNVADQTDLERDLRQLEASLRKLETEYNMYFAGTLPRPPLETRTRVEKMLRRYDRAYIQSYADRFRLTTLQSRFSSFTELWDRAIRAREEGRPGPFARPPRVEEPPPAQAEPAAPKDRVLCEAKVSDPGSDREKVLSLYESLVEARRATGNEEPFPFHRFAQMIKTQVGKLRDSGSGEVAFRVAVKDNKVTFTARGVKAGKAGEGGD
jgi:hypothetical protein